MNANHANRAEAFFKTSDGCELFLQSWSPIPTAPCHGTLVVTHGMAEHSEAYDLFASNMTAFGWKVIAWDLRGHGKSQGKRGDISDVGLFFRDLQELIVLLEKDKMISGNFGVVGHSMGGLISVRWAQEYGLGKAKLLALSSPLLGVAIEVPKLKDFAAKVLLKILPDLTLANDIQFDELSRDREILQDYRRDPLRHDRISSRFYFGLLQQMDLAMKFCSSMPGPVFIQASGHDRIVSLPMTRKFYSEIGTQDKWLKVYNESYHEIYNDLDRETVFADLNVFLLERLK